jgi:molybdate transport system permease protein
LTQVPAGDAAALRLVIVAIVISFIALIASEWLARNAGKRVRGE